MKIICARKELLEGVQIVAHATSTKDVLPVMKHILIRAENNSVSLAGTDLEISLGCKVSALKIEEEGALTVPADPLKDILGALPEDGEVTLEQGEKQTVAIKCGKSRFKIHSLNAEEFPMLPEIEGTCSFKIDGQTLRNAVRRVLPSVADKEARGVLQGVFLAHDETDEENTCRLVSTDTHRLGIQTCAISDLQGRLNAIVPKRALDELDKITDSSEISVTVSDNQIRFANEDKDLVLVSRLFDGQYPAYQRLIPKSHNMTFKVDKSALAPSIKRAAIIADAEMGAGKLTFKLEKNKLVITAISEALGEAYEEVEVEHEGDDITIGFNHKFVLDVLNVLDRAEEIEIKLIEPLKPAIVNATPDCGYFSLVMPME